MSHEPAATPERNTHKTLVLPPNYGFASHGSYNFDLALRFFDWSLTAQDVTIDFRHCKKANYQAVSLIVLYAWHLREKGCNVRFRWGSTQFGASKMWIMMGARDLFQVLDSKPMNFRSKPHKPLIAIRDNEDFRMALQRAQDYTQGFNVEYEKTLRYVLSELLYNTMEHGHDPHIPSLIQFAWYVEREEISFIIADLGVGIRRHLGRAYPGLDSDAAAIRLALKPQVSGTFVEGRPYQAKNNAGVGLYISSNITRRLHADMHIVSGNGVVHVSPTDTTERTLAHQWPGTFVYVTIKLGKSQNVNLQRMMAEFREEARFELAKASEEQGNKEFYLSINNYFGMFAEDKQAAIRFRETRLLPAIRSGKSVLIDFIDVTSAPHSFLNALLAEPIRLLGMAAYKKLKVVNVPPEIRETIDFILDENTALPE